MKLSIIIPFYNEEDTIAEVIEAVSKIHLENIEIELIAVDDGSNDSSYDKVVHFKHITLIKHPRNKGKGAAVKTGFDRATGDLLIVQDGDLELSPNEIPSLVEVVKQKQARVVYGSRQLDGRNKKQSTIYYLGGILVTFCTNLLFGTQLTDAPCGYKLFEAQLIKDIEIKEDGFNWEPEVTAKISKKGIKIHEVPVSYIPRTVQQGKKLRFSDGLSAIWTLIKYRFIN